MRILKFLSLLALVAPCALSANYVGDYAPGDIIDCKFGTVRPSTGASFTLGGTPAISAYKDNSTTQSTTGITLTADFDSVTGANHVRVTTASDASFYSAGSHFDLLITTGTVDSVSVTGQPVCSFTLRKVDKAGVIAEGTAQAATGTTLQLASAETFADDEIIGATCVITGGSAGVGQARVISDYVSATDTATVATWTTTPTGTISYQCHGTPSSTFATDSINAAAIAADAGTELGTAAWAAATRRLTELDEDTTTIDLNATATGAAASVTGAVGSVTGSVGSVTGSVGSVTGNVGGNLAGSVGSVTGNVGGSVASVTGNVGGNVSGNVTGSVGSVAANGVSATSLSADAGTELAAALLAAQGIITGTSCDSGSTTTCVAAALTYADATILEDRIACFSDGWCGLITTFAPGSDTITFTKVAPSTRAAKAYTIFPATLD